MKPLARIDLLFGAVLSKFYSISARAPTAGRLTFAELRVLRVLDWIGPSTLTGLASHLGIAPPAASEVVDRLVGRGFVRRVRAKEDRRRLVLSLRDRGRRLMGEFDRQRRSRLGKVLGALSPREAVRMERALATLRELLGRFDGEGR